jgi:hypothetical protein
MERAGYHTRTRERGTACYGWLGWSGNGTDGSLPLVLGMVTIEPGGVFGPLHDHSNRGTIPVVEISVDIVRPE